MKIKSCPFCGKTEEIRITNHGGFGVNCICGGMFFDGHQKIEKAIKAWNTRADDWINIKKRLPDKGKLVLGWYYDYVSFPVIVEYKESIQYPNNEFDHIFINASTREAINISHWKPLPEPPEVDNDI